MKTSGTATKRFYKTASVARDSGGFAVLLDGRGLRTPKKSALVVPVQALADAIAAEWNAQGVEIDPATMPLTRLANSILDAVVVHCAEVAADIVAFAGSDALCYRAEAPADLVQLQSAALDPILGWAARTLSARFLTQTGITPITQPPQTLAAIAAVTAQLTPWQLAPVHVMTTLTGSAVLALAVARQHLTVEAAWAAAHIDEDWQIARWGDDGEAQTRRANRWREMVAASVTLSTLL